MTIASEISKVAYSGNGSTTRFAIPFPFLRQADLLVLLRGVDGGDSILSLSTHYGLEKEGSGGACVMNTPPAKGETLVIRRDPAIVQETVYEEGVPLSAKAREDALDLVTMICQANRERVNRAVKFSPTSMVGEATMPDPQGGRAIVWTSDGTGLENGPAVVDIETANDNAVAAFEAKMAAEAARDSAQAAQAITEAARDSVQAVVGLTAEGVSYDNATSGLTSGFVQGALDELAYDTSVLAGLGRQMSLGFYQLMDAQAMGSMDVVNRRLETFEGSSGIDAASSSGYLHDPDGDFVKPASQVDTVAINFADSADFEQEDVKEAITTLVVDTANTSGHFTDGAMAQKIVDADVGIDPTEGTTTGDMTGSGGLAAAFDGNSATYAYEADTGNDSSVGKMWPMPRAISKAVVSPNGATWFTGVQPGTIHLEASNDTTDGLNGSWTVLDSLAVTNQSSATLNGAADVYTAHRIRFDPTNNVGKYCSELVFFEKVGADAPKVIPGTRVVTADGEVVITGITNQGDGTNEVAFSGTLAAGSHVVMGIFGTRMENGKLCLNSYHQSGATDVCSGGTPAASSAYSSSYDAAKAFDDDLGTYWSALAQGGGAWIQYLFNETKLINTVTINTQSSSDGWSTSVTVQKTTDNGTTWEDVQIFPIPAPQGNVEYAFKLTTPVSCNGIRLVSPDSPTNRWALRDVKMYEDTILVPTNTTFSTLTKEIESVAWTKINSASVVETLNGQSAYYAISTDAQWSFGVHWSGNLWRAIVSRKSSEHGGIHGDLYYRDNDSGWVFVAAADDIVDTSYNHAISQAVENVNNQMSATDLSALVDAEMPAIDGAVRVATSITSTEAGATPEVDTITMNAAATPVDMTLQLTALETTGIPDKATVLTVIKEVDALALNTDLIAEVSRDGGNSWDKITLAKVADFLLDRIVLEGFADITHADGGNDLALVRLKSVAGKDMEVHFMSLGVTV